MSEKKMTWLGRAIMFFVIALLFGVSYFFVHDAEVANKRIEKEYKEGSRIDISSGTYTVTKKVLANGKCYYIYEGNYKAFVIPCEEK